MESKSTAVAALDWGAGISVPYNPLKGTERNELMDDEERLVLLDRIKRLKRTLGA